MGQKSNYEEETIKIAPQADLKSRLSGRIAKNDNQNCQPLLPISTYQPSTEFCAVLLKTIDTCTGQNFEIILAHPALDQSILVANCNNDLDVIADWRFIGARLNLPLLTLNQSGQIQPFLPAGYNTQPRRYGSALSGRRPRFMARRKEGMPCLMAIIY